MPYVSGLDPGKTIDPAALAVCEQVQVPDPLDPRRLCWAYHVVHLQQWPLGTPYVSIGTQQGLGEQVRDLFSREPLRGSQVAVDQTGVGSAVIDILRGLNPPCVLTGIVQTGGERWKQEGLTYHVSKASLVSLLVSVMHSGRLKIAPALALAPVLAKQLASFREKQKQSGSLSWEADKVSDHDDLVMALACTCWLGDRSPPFSRGDISTGRRVAAQMPAGVFLEQDRVPGRCGNGGWQDDRKSRKGRLPARW